MRQPEVHIVPTRVYAGVAVALMVLLALTIGLASLDLGSLNWVASLGIAVAKALLVALFFMHLKYDSPLVRVFACVGLVWFSLLISGSVYDYLTRVVPHF